MTVGLFPFASLWEFLGIVGQLVLLKIFSELLLVLLLSCVFMLRFAEIHKLYGHITIAAHCSEASFNFYCLT